MSGQRAKCWRVYVLRCADGSFYTGITTDLQRRLREHNGELTGGARYTRGRRPVALHYKESARDRSVAARREAALRRLTRAEKMVLRSGKWKAGPRPKTKPGTGFLRAKRVA